MKEDDRDESWWVDTEKEGSVHTDCDPMNM